MAKHKYPTYRDSTVKEGNLNKTTWKRTLIPCLTPASDACKFSGVKEDKAHSKRKRKITHMHRGANTEDIEIKTKLIIETQDLIGPEKAIVHGSVVQS